VCIGRLAGAAILDITWRLGPKAAHAKVQLQRAWQTHNGGGIYAGRIADLIPKRRE
jgi:hypothetical protein